MKAAQILLYLLGGIIGALGFIPALPLALRIVCSVAVYLYFGYEIIIKTVRAIGKGDIWNENFLMTLATVGAFCLGEFADAAAVMFLYSLGECLSDAAYDRSMDSLRSMMETSPENVTVLREGKKLSVPPEEVSVGELISVLPGELILLDGRVEEGKCSADTSAITGESLPVSLFPGEKCVSGSVCLDGSITVRVETACADSVLARMSAAAKEAVGNKAKKEKFITKFARVYTPCAVFAAIAVAVIGSIISASPAEWIRKGLMILVISCPCALVLSVPLCYFAGMGAGYRRGILFKGGGAIDSLSHSKVAVFDKTGTLTENRPKIEKIISDDPAEFSYIAFSALEKSAHPLSKTLCESLMNIKRLPVCNHREQPGEGSICEIDGKIAVFGRAALLEKYGITVPETEGTVVHGGYDGKYLGCVTFSDNIKESAAPAISSLRKLGIDRFVMLSGDRQSVADKVAEKLGIGESFGGLYPDDKVGKLREIQKTTKGEVIFCGDGLNDSAVLATASAGVAMGGSASAAAVEAADTVIMGNDLTKLPLALSLSKKTTRIAAENIVFSLAVKLLIMVLGLTLLPSLELAVAADVGVTLIAVANAVRNR